MLVLHFHRLQVYGLISDSDTNVLLKLCQTYYLLLFFYRNVKGKGKLF